MSFVRIRGSASRISSKTLALNSKASIRLSKSQFMYTDNFSRLKLLDFGKAGMVNIDLGNI